MKVALITDLHFDYKPDNPQFEAHTKKFYDEVFFPTIEDRNLKTVVILGDVFDKRKSVNTRALKQAKDVLFDRLNLKGIKTLILVGNHDAYFKNTIALNSLNVLEDMYDNVTVIREPGVFLNRITMIPWICADNEEASYKLIERVATPYCFGHFEISGFGMSQGTVSNHGIDRSIFKNYDVVLSGHYHTRSTDGQIWYLGCPYEMTWADYADQKGMHVFDLDTGDLEFIKNPHTFFAKVYYDDTEEVQTPERESINGKTVRVVVTNSSDNKKLDKFIATLQSFDPFDLKVVENKLDVSSVSVPETIDVKDTIALIEEYVDQLDIKRKEQVTNIMKSLYAEAQTTMG